MQLFDTEHTESRPQSSSLKHTRPFAHLPTQHTIATRHSGRGHLHTSPSLPATPAVPRSRNDRTKSARVASHTYCDCCHCHNTVHATKQLAACHDTYFGHVDVPPQSMSTSPKSEKPFSHTLHCAGSVTAHVRVSERSARSGHAVPVPAGNVVTACTLQKRRIRQCDGLTRDRVIETEQRYGEPCNAIAHKHAPIVHCPHPSPLHVPLTPPSYPVPSWLSHHRRPHTHTRP
jgi:hypothetical protein